MPLFNPVMDSARRFERDYAQSLITRFQTLPLPGSTRIPLEREYTPVRGLAAALAAAPTLLLTGADGAGKTTVLVHLALAHARGLLSGNPQARIPLFISGATYEANRPLQFSGLPRGLAVGDTLATRCPAGFFNQALAAGRLFVLIDDLDVLPAAAAQTLLKEFDRAHIAATGRATIPGLAAYPLPPWRDGEIYSYAQQVHGNRATPFLAALKEGRVPRVLTSNPLTLALLAHLWQEGQPLPTRRTPLFDEYAESILGSANDTAKLLEDLALAAYEDKPISIAHLTRSRGLLRANSDHTAEFVHPLWQAYFAARALHVKPGGWQSGMFDDARWEQVLLFYAGLGNSGGLVDELSARGRSVLAGRIIAQAAPFSADRVDKVIDPLIEQAWNGDANAVVALAELNNTAVLDKLAARLKDEDAAVRGRAVQILGEMRLDRGTDLVLPLLRDPDAHVREQVLAAMGRSPSDRVVDPLLVVLRGDTRAGPVDSGMRAGAIRALGQIGSDRAVPALLVDLQSGDPAVRAAAAAALKQISTPLSLKPLDSLAQSGDEESRRYAAEILAVAKHNTLVGLKAPR